MTGYKVMGRMEDGQYHCFGWFPNEESACLARLEANNHDR